MGVIIMNYGLSFFGNSAPRFTSPNLLVPLAQLGWPIINRKEEISDQPDNFGPVKSYGGVYFVAPQKTDTELTRKSSPCDWPLPRGQGPWAHGALGPRGPGPLGPRGPRAHGALGPRGPWAHGAPGPTETLGP